MKGCRAIDSFSYFYNNKVIWRINKLLLPHNLYSGTNHIPLFILAPFYYDQTNTIKLDQGSKQIIVTMFLCQ